MDKYIMVGADVHDKSMLLKIAEGLTPPEKRSFQNTPSGHQAMIALLNKRAQAAKAVKVIVVYEASCLGFILCDALRDAGFDCHVLAPTKIARSPEHRRRKTDERDAEHLLEILRGHVLAGNKLPSVWVPDRETRDNREIVRAYLDTSEKLTALKSQVRMLLKRNGVKKPSGIGKGWTKRYQAWLRGLSGPRSDLAHGARVALGSLLRQMEALEDESRYLHGQIAELSHTPRYQEPVRALMNEPGVGLLTAMLFLTEMGDLSRFTNRRKIGAFLGLVPSSNESGESGERKGHITHQGPWRVRRVLCQASWARVRTHKESEAIYQRITKRNPRHKKIGIVAVMRLLAIRLWHIGLNAQQENGCFINGENVTAA